MGEVYVEINLISNWSQNYSKNSCNSVIKRQAAQFLKRAKGNEHFSKKAQWARSPSKTLQITITRETQVKMPRAFLLVPVQFPREKTKW
jgi:hypothetical protein